MQRLALISALFTLCLPLMGLGTDNIEKAVVRISADIRGEESTSTGFILKYKGEKVIMTTLHGVAGASKLIVSDFSTLVWRGAEAKIIAIDMDNDLAIITHPKLREWQHTLKIIKTTDLQFTKSVEEEREYGKGVGITIYHHERNSTESMDAYVRLSINPIRKLANILNPQGRIMLEDRNSPKTAINVLALTREFSSGASGSPVIFNNKVIGVFQGSFVTNISWATTLDKLSFNYSFSGSERYEKIAQTPPPKSLTSVSLAYSPTLSCSCKEIKSRFPEAATGFYRLKPANKEIEAYCEMDLGWTVVKPKLNPEKMKITQTNEQIYWALNHKSRDFFSVSYKGNNPNATFNAWIPDENVLYGDFEVTVYLDYKWGWSGLRLSSLAHFDNGFYIRNGPDSYGVDKCGHQKNSGDKMIFFKAWDKRPAQVINASEPEENLKEKGIYNSTYPTKLKRIKGKIHVYQAGNHLRTLTGEYHGPMRVVGYVHWGFNGKSNSFRLSDLRWTGGCN